MSKTDAKGKVILVGAGPGDPGLLTLAAKEAIETADVILYDKLVGPGVLALMPPKAEQINVGKTSGHHPVPQDGINRLIVEHAAQGKTVVRLKGGDPYLFGRGAEELEEVIQQNIPFRVIPGVTSAIAAPAYAGIPVTHRDCASSLHIFTGHAKEGAELSIPFAEAAKLNGTLVFLMGVAAAERICDSLIAAGMPADTPAALVENGTRENQRRLDATLSTLPARAREMSFGTPSILVIGAVCALAPKLDWTAALPLRGRRVLVTTSAKTGSRLAALLRENGCAVDEFTAIEMTPLPRSADVWQKIGRYAWIALTSEFGVDCLFDALAAASLDTRAVARARFAVVGERTRAALARRGIRADLMPEEQEYNGKTLARLLAERTNGNEKILLFRAESGAPELPEELRKRGAAFDDIAAYRTTPRAPARNILETLSAGGYDAVAFASASAVDALAGAVPPDTVFPRAFCIGEMTARAAERHGMTATTSAAATLAALTEAITKTLGRDRRQETA